MGATAAAVTLLGAAAVFTAFARGQVTLPGGIVVHGPDHLAARVLFGLVGVGLMGLGISLYRSEPSGPPGPSSSSPTSAPSTSTLNPQTPTSTPVTAPATPGTSAAVTTGPSPSVIAAARPALTVSPDPMPVGEAVFATGRGFPPNTYIELRLGSWPNDTLVGQVKPQQGDQFTVRLTAVVSEVMCGQPPVEVAAYRPGEDVPLAITQVGLCR